jgi:hypothetical protein
LLPLPCTHPVVSAPPAPQLACHAGTEHLRALHRAKNRGKRSDLVRR